MWHVVRVGSEMSSTVAAPNLLVCWMTARSGPLPLMQTPIYYPKAEFIETVSVAGFDKKTDIADVVAVKDTGNKVSRRATISGPQNIILGGKTIISNGAIIRGDLKRAGPGHAVVISLGRYCLVGEGCVMRCVSSLLSRFCPTQSTSISFGSSRPPYKTYRGAFNYYPMKVGDYVHIGANTIVEAATIGNHVEIGKNCVIVKCVSLSFIFCASHVCVWFFASAGEIHNYQGLRKDCR